MLFAVLVLLLAPGQGLATGGGTVGRVFGDGFELQREERLPAPDSVLPADALPRVGLRLLEGSVEPSSWNISLDGKNVTAQSQVSATEIMYTPSAPLFEGTHVVEVRTGARTVAWNFTTRTPPSIGAYGPLGEVPPDDLRPEIFAQYTDVGSGIDPARVRLLLDGVDITSLATVGAIEIRWQSPQDLPDGERFVSLEVLDRAGNPSTAAWSFTVGPQPIVEIVAPQEELLPFGARPEISVTVTLTRGTLDPESVVLFLNDVDLSQELQIAQPSPSRLEVQIQPPVGLPSGSYQVYAEARSQAGLGGFASRQFSVDIERSYLLEFVPPAQGSVILDPAVEIWVRANSTSGAPRVITLDGESPLSRRIEDGNYVYRWVAELNPGANTLRARAEFPDGGSRTTELQLTHERAPTISISTPSDWSILGPPQRAAGGAAGDSRDLTGGVQRAVTVTGTTSEPVVDVQVNQQQAQLSADGRGFTFANFFLHEGTNLIGAVARDTHGRSATAQITVYVDQTAPLLTVESPEAEAVTSRQRIDVRGVVNDAVEGRLGAEQPEVEVRNRANEAVISAQVTNLGYLALDVPLEVGANTLAVTARDQHGNARSREVTVVRTAVGASRLLLLGGDRQSGLAETDLEDALEVQAIDVQGMPLQGHVVRFDVLRGSGSIRDGAAPVHSDGVNPARNLHVLTDAEGIARVWLRLGRDARPGSDVVRAASTALAEDVIFTASALAGEAHQIGVYGAAGAQYVATDSTPVEALMAQVLDAQDNPVADAAVEFAVITGGASFGVRSGAGGVAAQDGRAITVRTDRNGVAAVRPLSGPQPGTAQIRAEVIRADGSRIGEAVFQLEVLARRDGPTALSGLVMDHDGTPLEGIRLSLSRTPLSVLSDAAGYFRFPAQVPPGKVDLFVDGRDVRFTRGGAQFEYPALHFETAIVQGQENQLPHPVYLPPVETSRAVVVGGANDVTLTLPGFEGFEMIVRANSVTFPDGSREGPLVVSAVHADRLPMVPPGMAGRFATVGWTIQPTGTRFDPPIEVQIPNTGNLAPGRTLPIVQWDHDLAAFVPMGNGTVSEDSTRIVSDAGSGITKAGWGGVVDPPPPDNTGCGPRPTVQISAEGRTSELYFGITPEGSPPTHWVDVQLKATVSGTCEAPGGLWFSGDGSPPIPGSVVSKRFSTTGEFSVHYQGWCAGKCPSNFQSDSLDLTVFKASIRPQAHPEAEMTEEPKMPDLRWEADVEPASAIPFLEFRWEMELTYDRNARSDVARIPLTGYESIMGRADWTPTWAGVLQTANKTKTSLEVSHPASNMHTSKSENDQLTIQGKNPARSDVEAEASSGPWFIGALIQQESTFRQFIASPGYPLHGVPNGFGLMQLDPPPSDATVHNWRQNVADGLVRLNVHRIVADDRWTGPTGGQRTQYELYISNPANIGLPGQPACGNVATPCIPHHSTISTGGCEFAHDPVGAQRSFRDGIWIKNYNGATTLWMVWKNNDLPSGTLPFWRHNYLGATGENYVAAVCSHIP